MVCGGEGGVWAGTHAVLVGGWVGGRQAAWCVCVCVVRGGREGAEGGRRGHKEAARWLRVLWSGDRVGPTLQGIRQTTLHVGVREGEGR